MSVDDVQQGAQLSAPHHDLIPDPHSTFFSSSRVVVEIFDIAEADNGVYKA